MLRVAINGYGRIGRNIHRQFLQYHPHDVEVVAVNASSDAAMRAYLLKYDSLHGRFAGEVRPIGENMEVNGKIIRIVRERDPTQCPWRELDTDIVVESTGNFETRGEVEGHLKAGARKVIVTAPMKDDTPILVRGVNDALLSSSMDIISNASCTTNCIAPVMKVIDDTFGIDSLLVGSVHAYTASQNLLDNKPKEGNDFRRARAATLSVIPTKTGAMKACASIFPHLKGKIGGMAFRVPVPTVSCAYMAFTLTKETTQEKVLTVLQSAAVSEELRDILSVSLDPCVSIDFQTDPHSSIIDGPFIKVLEGNVVQILAWYDNEWGYAMRVTEMTLKVGSMISSPLPHGAPSLSKA